MKPSITVKLLICLLGLLSACSATKMKNAWQSPTFTKSQLNNVLVVGFSASTVNRMVFEQEFSYQLAQAGIASTESFKVIGREIPDKATIKKYVTQHNIDYVLITYQSGQDVTKEYIEPQVTTIVSGNYPVTAMDRINHYPTLDSYWSPGSFITLRSGGYEEQTVKVFLVTSIYRASTGKIVWTGKSSIFDPDSVSEAATQIAKVILKNIK